MDAARRRWKRTTVVVAQRRASVNAAADGVPPPAWLTVGALVVDTNTRRRGEVQDWSYPDSTPVWAWLRPVGGGREWTPRISDLRPTESES